MRHDGSRFWANTLITALRDADGKLVAYSHFTRDRTERKRSEEEHAQLLEHAERARRDAEAAQLSYRFLTQAIPQIVWTARANGELDYFNRRWFEYSGLAVAESEGLQWQQAIHPDDLARTVERWHAAVLDGESYEIEYRLRRRDGSYRWHLARGSPERDRAGNVSKWFGTFTDIDDQKRAEESQRSPMRARCSLDRWRLAPRWVRSPAWRWPNSPTCARSASAASQVGMRRSPFVSRRSHAWDTSQRSSRRWRC
ncbi:MAG: PAS domain S-box protein [Planctomycetota bacterium]